MQKILFSLVFVLVIFCGCKSFYTGTIRKWPEKEHYEVIPNAKLQLKIISKHQLVAGVDDTINIQLTNVGNRDLRIEEWREKAVDNIRLFYQDWLPGTEEPNEKKWIEIPRVDLVRPMRFPLDLSPGVSVIVPMGLPFLTDIKITPGKERRFFLKASLNLNSVSASTGVFAIAVY